MTEKYRVHDLAKFHYSEIGEYIDENHTDRPLRNDIVVDLLNQLNNENEKLKQSNSQLARVNREGTKKVQKLSEENRQLKQTSQDYEDIVNNWFINNWDKLSGEMKQSAHLEVGIDIEYGGDYE